MICLYGKKICGGMVSGAAYVFNRKCGRESVHQAASVDEEQRRLGQAMASVREELTNCIAQARNETAKEIYEIHRMMLEDEDVLEYLQTAVQQAGTTAEQAASETERYFAELFRSTQDDYMIARIDDVRDVMDRVIACLTEEQDSDVPEEPFILVTEELLPGDLMRFGSEKLKGIATGSGTLYSHASILVKEMGIPALITENASSLKTGMKILLDADDEILYADPDDETAGAFAEKEALAAEKKQDSPFRHLPCDLYVNIGDAREVSAELFSGCDGVGLFRTEFMFLNRPELPDEEEQFAAYRCVLEKAKGKKVVIRTFDIGSDKAVPALPLGKEENPALGFRGLRVYSLYPEIFRTQLRALLRAAVYGNLSIMYPMVVSKEEILKLRQILTETAEELKAQGIPYQIPPQGAMIETPAAALLSDELAEAADFFSVGTNDLTQYTLAVDRQDGRLDPYCDRGHRAVLELIRLAAASAHRHGIRIGICGELASQPDLIEKWKELGIDYLSVSPAVLK